MLYGSETWAVTAAMNNKLESTEMRMIRKMCNVQRRDRLKNQDLRNRVDVESIIEVARRNRLRWYGHVERKGDGDWVKKMYEIGDEW